MARRRLRPNPENVRSTTYRRGSTAKPAATSDLATERFAQRHPKVPPKCRSRAPSGWKFRKMLSAVERGGKSPRCRIARDSLSEGDRRSRSSRSDIGSYTAGLPASPPGSALQPRLLRVRQTTGRLAARLSVDLPMRLRPHVLPNLHFVTKAVNRSNLAPNRTFGSGSYIRRLKRTRRPGRRRARKVRAPAKNPCG